MKDRGGRRELNTERFRLIEARENDEGKEGARKRVMEGGGQDTEGASETMIERSRDITRDREKEKKWKIDGEMGY